VTQQGLEPVQDESVEVQQPAVGIDPDIVGGEEEADIAIEEEPLAETVVAVIPPAPVMSATEAMAHANIAVRALVGGSSNQYEAAMKIIRGHELGIGPAAAVENIYVVNNRTAMGAGLIGSLIKKSGRYNYKVIKHTEAECSIDFYEDGIIVGNSPFTIDNAKEAGLVKARSPWLMYPRNMLFARALSNGARWYCPDVFHGSIYTPEELGEKIVTTDSVPLETIGAPPQALAQASQAPGSAPAAEAPVAAPSVAYQPEEFARDKYAADVDWATEECPIHRSDPSSLAAAVYQDKARPVAFFKGGRMRDYAHSLGTGKWCNRKEVIANLRTFVEGRIADRETQYEQMLTEQFGDISSVPSDDWRAQDWWAVKAVVMGEAVLDAATPTTSGSTEVDELSV